MSKIIGVTVGTPLNPDKFGGGGDTTVDAALSETSTNPVQNKVVYLATESVRALANANRKRIVALEQNFESLQNQGYTVSEVEGYALAICDAEGNIVWAITEEGEVVSAQKRVTVTSDGNGRVTIKTGGVTV